MNANEIARKTAVWVPTAVCAGYLGKAVWCLAKDDPGGAFSALKVAAIAGGSAIAAVVVSEVGDHFVEGEKK